MNRTESTIIAGGFNTLLSEMDKSSRQKISKDIIALNTTINQLDIMTPMSYFIQQQQNTHILLKFTWTFTKTDDILGCKTYLDTLKGFLDGSVIHLLMQEREGSVPGSGRSPGGGNGNPLQYSWLENLMDRRAWRATAHGVIKSQTRLSEHWKEQKSYHVCSQTIKKVN